jgi:hypothetical protein
MHEAAVTYRGKDRGERQFGTQNSRAEITMRHRNRIPRPEGHVFERATILAQCELALGASVDIVEDRGRQTTPGQAPQVIDVDDMGRCDSSC